MLICVVFVFVVFVVCWLGIDCCFLCVGVGVLCFWFVVFGYVVLFCIVLCCVGFNLFVFCL